MTWFTQEQQSALNRLNLDWEDEYDITMSATGWMAILKADRTVVVRADDPEKLRWQIREDYARRAELRRAAERGEEV